VTGRVVLVGAGPGDPRLLTLAGAEALAEADAVAVAVAAPRTSRARTATRSVPRPTRPRAPGRKSAAIAHAARAGGSGLRRISPAKRARLKAQRILFQRA
jgi:siroheme synthase